jgi:hypothetical protein
MTYKPTISTNLFIKWLRRISAPTLGHRPHIHTYMTCYHAASATGRWPDIEVETHGILLMNKLVHIVGLADPSGRAVYGVGLQPLAC